MAEVILTRGGSRGDAKRPYRTKGIDQVADESKRTINQHVSGGQKRNITSFAKERRDRIS